MARRTGKFVLAIIVGFAIVAFWRGAWGLLDIYLFPGSHELSFWASLLLGVAILSVNHQELMR
ncbi:MAG: hypothetical protein HY365_00470 [Candidatus Aenigmarchaeota archaeon]|nr:hypothetical protein [Candidatus Aenigmarchaeota archaeon]